MTVGFKTRIYPTQQQVEILERYCKVAHDMYNFLVAKYKNQLPVVNAYGIKNYKEADLMADFGEIIPSRIVRGVIFTYATAVLRFWNKLGNPPVFHKYNPNKKSFYSSATVLTIRKGKIQLPYASSGRHQDRTKLL